MNNCNVETTFNEISLTKNCASFSTYLLWTTDIPAWHIILNSDFTHNIIEIYSPLSFAISPHALYIFGVLVVGGFCCAVFWEMGR